MLTEAEVIEGLLLLKLPASAGAEVFFGAQSKVMVRAQKARQLLAALTGPAEAKARALIEDFTPIANDTDRLNAKGLDSDPGRTRASLQADLERLIGLPPASAGGIRIQRG